MKKDLTIKQRKISEKKFKEWKQKLKEKTLVLTGEDMHNLYDCLDICKSVSEVKLILEDNNLLKWFNKFFIRLEKRVVPEIYTNKITSGGA